MIIISYASLIGEGDGGGTLYAVLMGEGNSGRGSVYDRLWSVHSS